MDERISVEAVATKILLVRGKKVMLDKDLAQLYGVSTKTLNQAVKRNYSRFPDDFMFQLTKDEAKALRSQFVTLNDLIGNKEDTISKRGKHLKYLPFVFTEQGVAMLSSVLNSERAIHVNIAIMRVFVKLREILLTHKELAVKVEEHDHQIKALFEIIKDLLNPPPEPPKPKIGFQT